eukprot:m.47704 g.47704  ORF g.47704 m.47704 type:complete len:382 (+) comp10526_c0_seq3:166-1311(+)
MMEEDEQEDTAAEVEAAASTEIETLGTDTNNNENFNEIEPCVGLTCPASYNVGHLIYEHKGEFSVHAATCKGSEERVAVKLITEDGVFKNNRSLDGIVQTLHLAILLEHVNIGKVIASFVEEERRLLWIISPFHLGTLYDVFVAPRDKMWDEATIAIILKGTLSGLGYIHSHHYIHRSLTSSSIVVNPGGTPIIYNLENMVSLLHNGSLKSVMHDFHQDENSIAWAAPEYLRQDMIGYSEKIDIYSIGIISLELVFGAHPFQGLLPTAVLHLKLQDEKGPLSIISSKRKPSSRMLSFLSECLREEDFNRPSADKLKVHPLVKNAKKYPTSVLSYLTSIEENEIDMTHQNESTDAEYDSKFIREVSKEPFPELNIGGLMKGL